MTDHLYRVILHPLENRLAICKWRVVGETGDDLVVESCNLPENSRTIRVRIPKDQTSSPSPGLNVYHFCPADAYFAFAQVQVNTLMKGVRLQKQAEKTLENLQRDIPADTVVGYDPARLPWQNMEKAD